MKDFLVNVATGAMASLVEKLGTMLTVDEYKLLTDVHGDIEFLRNELEAMQAFLLMMADVEESDHETKFRANTLRELSYDIEDKIDKFMLLVNHESSSNNDDFRELLNKSMEKIANLKTRHKIAEDIKDIKSQLKDVTDRYARYKIDESSRPRSEKADPRILVVYKDASELVGIDGPRDALVEWISSETGASESANQIKVISTSRQPVRLHGLALKRHIIVTFKTNHNLPTYQFYVDRNG